MQDMVGGNDIAFPNLGIYLNNVPKSFSVFGFQIALYGVIIGIGVICGVLMAAHVSKKENMDSDMIWDFAIYAIIFSIIGARIYYVVFEWDMYKDNLLDVFNLRNGGLAIYGAVIAAFLTLFIYTRIRKQSFLRMVDVCVPGLILGQAIGRWGNFTNREVFGGYTDNLLAMRLPRLAVRTRDITPDIDVHAIIINGVEYIQVHPTFLYECLWNLFILCLMLICQKHKKFNGEIWLLYLGGYGLGRFWIEAIRTDQLYFTGTSVPVSQLVAAFCVVMAILVDVVVRIRIRISARKTEQDS